MIYVLALALFCFYCGLPAKRKDLYGFWLVLLVAVMATTADAQSLVSKTPAQLVGCRGGRLKGLFHRGGESKSGCSSCSGGGCSGPNCGCGSSACTGQPGCDCGEAGCTCNGPTQVMQQDAVTHTRTRSRSVLSPRSAAASVRQQPAASRLDKAPRAPAEKPKSTPAPKATTDLSPDESRLFAGLNRLRESRGKPPVVVDPILMQVAREQLSDPRYSPHNSPRYGSAARHAARYGRWASVNDVVAAARWSDGSLSSPESSVDGWRQSDGRLRCILGQSNVNNRWIDEGYDRVGVARCGNYDLAVFGRRES